MKKNMGNTDRFLRTILAVLLAVLYFTNTITGTIGLVLLILGVVFLLTSMVGFCPLYLPFGIKTINKTEK